MLVSQKSSQMTFYLVFSPPNTQQLHLIYIYSKIQITFYVKFQSLVKIYSYVFSQPFSNFPTFRPPQVVFSNLNTPSWFFHLNQLLFPWSTYAWLLVTQISA